MEKDKNGCILHFFFLDLEDTYQWLVKDLCKSLYTQINSAVGQMCINLKTKRAHTEKTFPSPSDYGEQ